MWLFTPNVQNQSHVFVVCKPLNGNPDNLSMREINTYLTASSFYNVELKDSL